MTTIKTNQVAALLYEISAASPLAAVLEAAPGSHLKRDDLQKVLDTFTQAGNRLSPAEDSKVGQLLKRLSPGSVNDPAPLADAAAGATSSSAMEQVSWQDLVLKAEPAPDVAVRPPMQRETGWSGFTIGDEAKQLTEAREAKRREELVASSKRAVAQDIHELFYFYRHTEVPPDELAKTVQTSLANHTPEHARGQELRLYGDAIIEALMHYVRYRSWAPIEIPPFLAELGLDVRPIASALAALRAEKLADLVERSRPQVVDDVEKLFMGFYGPINPTPEALVGGIGASFEKRTPPHVKSDALSLYGDDVIRAVAEIITQRDWFPPSLVHALEQMDLPVPESMKNDVEKKEARRLAEVVANSKSRFSDDVRAILADFYAGKTPTVKRLAERINTALESRRPAHVKGDEAELYGPLVEKVLKEMLAEGRNVTPEMLAAIESDVFGF